MKGKETKSIGVSALTGIERDFLTFYKAKTSTALDITNELIGFFCIDNYAFAFIQSDLQ